MALIDFIRNLAGRDDDEEKRKNLVERTRRIFKQDEFDPERQPRTLNQNIRKFAGDRFNDALDYKSPSMKASVREAVQQTIPELGPGFRDLISGKNSQDYQRFRNIPGMDTTTEFIANRVAEPIARIPENIKTMRSDEASFFEKGLAGASTVGALVPGVDDALFAAGYDVPKARLAGRDTTKAFTGEEYTGLGDALAQNNEMTRDVLNVAELPLILGVGSLAAKKQASKNLASQAPAVSKTVRQGLKIDPSQGLSKAEATVERRFIEKINKDVAGAINEYKQKFGKVLNTDNARELSEDYNKSKSTLSRAVHEPASALVKKIYEEELKTPDPTGENIVLFTAGGTGAGKTTGIEDIPQLTNVRDKAQIIYDTNMNGYRSAKKKVDQALKSGKRVVVAYVHRDPVEAFENGSLPRAMKRGRTVPIEAHIDTHVGAPDTALKLAKEFAEDENFSLEVVDNTHGKGGAQLSNIALLENSRYNSDELRRILNETLENNYAKGRISKEVYEGTRQGTKPITGQNTTQRNITPDSRRNDSELALPNEPRRIDPLLDQRSQEIAADVKTNINERTKPRVSIENLDDLPLVQDNQSISQTLKDQTGYNADQLLNLRAGDVIRKNANVDALFPKLTAEQSNLLQRYEQGKYPTSNELFHITPQENIESIAKEGLATGKKPRFEGVSSKNKISLSANEEAARYYGKENDAMLRVKPDYAEKIDDLETDLLSGEGTYTTGKNIPPEALEIKVGDKWQPLSEYNKSVVLKDGKVRSTKKPKFQFDVSNLDGPDDIDELIRSTAEQNLTNVQKQRRGTITFKETRAMADAIGMSVDDVKKRNVGQIWNAEEADAAVRLTQGVIKKQEEVASKIKELGSEAPQDLKLELAQLTEQKNAMVASIIGDRSEKARALNASKMLKAALDPSDAKAQEAVRKMFGDKEKQKEVLDKLSQFDPEDDLGRAKFLRQVKPSSTIEKIEEYWYNSILSNTSTHIVNTVSGVVTTLMSIPEKTVAGALDAAGEAGAKALKKAYQRDRYAAEAAASAGNVGLGVKRGIRRAMHVIRNGISEDQATKLDIGRGQAIKGKVGDMVNVPSRGLVAEDEFIKGINYEMDLAGQATRQALQEGLTGAEKQSRIAELLADPTPQMMEAANEAARYRTFQSDSNIASSVRQLRDLAVKIPKAGDFRPLRFIIPFVQTPTNVVKYGLERSPAGLIGTAYKASTGAAKGEVIDSASRAIVGSSLLIPLAMYFTEDKIIGAPPKNKKERDAFYADKKIPYSVKIGDNWVAYNRLEPINTVLTQIAMWHDAHRNGAETTVEQISEFLRSSGRNIADQTFMTGIGNLVEAIEDPDRFGQKFVTDIIGGFVPSFVAAGARSIDDKPRIPETIGQSLKARVPGLSKEVPAIESQIEPGGEAIRHTNEGTLRNIMSNFVGFRSTPASDTTYQEDVRRIQSADKQTRGRKEVVNETALELISNIRNAPEEEKATVLREAIETGTLNGEVLKKMTSEVQQEAEDGGLSTEMNIIKGYSNETKARYIVEKMKTMEQEERASWLATMMSNGIITDETVKEIQRVAQEGESLPLIAR